MSLNSFILMSDTTGLIEKIGTPVLVDGLFAQSKGMHTISIHTTNFVGRVYIEASLAKTPEENDWFTINLNGGTAYVQYPKVTPKVEIDAFQFKGNFNWIRARMDRSNLGYEPSQQQLLSLGTVNKILLSR